jgi:hypothetical protein
MVCNCLGCHSELFRATPTAVVKPFVALWGWHRSHSSDTIAESDIAVNRSAFFLPSVVVNSLVIVPMTTRPDVRHVPCLFPLFTTVLG